MTRMAGFVFDSYDDPDGRVLRSLVPQIEAIPPFIKEAHRLNEDQIAQLPDDHFALVLFDGGRKMKKYATVDKGNTALSVMYLLKQAHLLPPDAVKVAAANLIAACEAHQLQVPPQLKIAALSGMSGVSGKSQKPYVRGAKVNKIQFPIQEVPGEYTEGNELGKGDSNEHDVIERTNFNGPQGTNFTKVPSFSSKEKQRTSATDAASPEGYEKVAHQFQVMTRQKVWRESPYVDISGWEPHSAEAVDHAPPSRTLLGDKYPVDSMEQVKLAADYFAEYKKQFHPRDRREYCVKLASRMSELRMTVPEEVARYGSSDYSADLDSYIAQRRILVDEKLLPAIDALYEKRAMVGPETFAEALEDFDKLAGIQYFWDSRVPDPYYSTFGPSVEKVAEMEWRYDENGARIGLVELEVLARNGRHLLKKSFGEDFTEAFCKNPKTVFESLPKPNKLMVARMAMSRHDGTPTE